MARFDWRQRHKLQHWALENLYTQKAEVPDDWPASERLRTDAVFPIYCGEYARGLTGSYAILNGLKLLLAELVPLKPSEEQMLLEVGWTFLSGREPLAPHRGIRVNTMVRLAEAMAFALSRRRADWVQCDRLELREYSASATATLLERLAVAKRVVLVLLGRGHYTVVRGYTRDSWLLFDATGRQWMLRRATGHNAIMKPILMLSRQR